MINIHDCWSVPGSYLFSEWCHGAEEDQHSQGCHNCQWTFEASRCRLNESQPHACKIEWISVILIKILLNNLVWEFKYIFIHLNGNWNTIHPSSSELASSFLHCFLNIHLKSSEPKGAEKILLFFMDENKFKFQNGIQLFIL